MPEESTRVVILGLKAAQRKFKELVTKRIAAEFDADEFLADIESLEREAKKLKNTTRKANSGNAPGFARGRRARQRKR